METPISGSENLGEGSWIRIKGLYADGHCLTEDPTLFYCGRSMPPEGWGNFRPEVDRRVTGKCRDCKAKRETWLKIPKPPSPKPMSRQEAQRLALYRRMLGATDVTESPDETPPSSSG